jgi:hypothetical protein
MHLLELEAAAERLRKKSGDVRNRQTAARRPEGVRYPATAASASAAQMKALL